MNVSPMRTFWVGWLKKDVTPSVRYSSGNGTLVLLGLDILMTLDTVKTYLLPYKILSFILYYFVGLVLYTN